MASADKAQKGPGLLLALGGLAGWAFWFYQGQNKGRRVGGPMSLPKIAWLSYALAAWYIVPAFSGATSACIRRCAGYTACTWARGRFAASPNWC